MVKEVMDVELRIPRGGKLDYTKEFIQKRIDWLSKKMDVKLEHIGNFSEDPENFRGNIENLIGAAQIPIGITGPLLINGEHAKGEFYVPMATTEGAMITDYNAGMRIVTKSGGLNAAVISNKIHISPVFFVKNLWEAEQLMKWVESNFKRIIQEAEGTTKHGKLLEIIPIIAGRRLILKFCYNAQDAHGMNMINKATEAACKFISKETGKKYFLRSRYSSVKTVSASNIFQGYGRAVFADGIIARKNLELFGITPEDIYAQYSSGILASVHSGMVGVTAHIANGLTGIFAACGQDLADISTSHIGVSMCEVTEEKDLYISLYIPNLLIGTVGGGTALATQKECLQIMGCYGSGKADKFAEIIVSACLAGELAVLASLAAGTFVEAHEKFGRNKPKGPV